MGLPILRSLTMCLGVLSAAWPAAAQETLLLLPARDVDVTYEVKLPKQRIVERVRWSADERLERVDGPDKSATIFNHKTEEITVLRPGDRTFRKLEGKPRPPIEPAADAKPQRGGETTVAGQHCVEWSWTEDVETHIACATADGVLLRLTVDGQEVRVARSVNYGRQQPELFQIPHGYTPALAPEGALEP
jgi:hypothetical protein